MSDWFDDNAPDKQETKEKSRATDQVITAAQPRGKAQAAQNGDWFEQNKPATKDQSSGHGAGGSWDDEPTKVGTMPRASEVWSAVNEPLIPEGQSEKEARIASESAPSKFDMDHPYLAGAKKGMLGAYADSESFARGLTSPLGIATMGLGEVGEAPGALGRIAKASSRIAGTLFGVQGTKQGYEGTKDIIENGVTPENLNKTLQGAGVKKVATAPVRAVSKAYNYVLEHPTAVKGSLIATGVLSGGHNPLGPIGGAAEGALVGSILDKMPRASQRWTEAGLSDFDKTVNATKELKSTYDEAQKEYNGLHRQMSRYERTGASAPEELGDAYLTAQDKLQQARGAWEHGQATQQFQKFIIDKLKDSSLPSEVRAKLSDPDFVENSFNSYLSKRVQPLIPEEKPATGNLGSAVPSKASESATAPDLVGNGYLPETGNLIPTEEKPSGPLGSAISALPVKGQVARISDLVQEGTGGRPLKPGVPLRDQGNVVAEEPALSSRPDKAVLQKAGANEAQLNKLLPINRVQLSKLAEHFDIDLGDKAIGRGKADLAAGTHLTREQTFERILKDHSIDEVEKAIDEGQHLPPVGGGSQGANEENGISSQREALKKQFTRGGDLNPHSKSAASEPELIPEGDSLGDTAQRYLRSLKPSEGTVEEVNGANVVGPHTVNIAGRTMDAQGVRRPTDLIPVEEVNSEASKYLGKAFPGQSSAVIPERSTGPISSEELNTQSKKYLGDIRRTSENQLDDQINQVADVRKRLGLKPSYSPVSEEAAKTSGRQPTSEELDRLRVRSGISYTYEEKPGEVLNTHKVTASDPKSNNAATVSATSEPGSDEWTVRMSHSDLGNNIGRDAYARLLLEAQKTAERTGKPIVVRSDASVSDAAMKTWQKLRDQYGFDVKMGERPFVEFTPKASAVRSAAVPDLISNEKPEGFLGSALRRAGVESNTDTDRAAMGKGRPQQFMDRALEEPFSAEDITPAKEAPKLGSLTERVMRAMGLSDKAKNSLRNLVHMGAVSEDNLLSTIVKSSPAELHAKYGGE